MNNRINALKKRADTIAEYVVDRCAKLEKENSWVRQNCIQMQAKLVKYDNAFFKTLNKIKEVGKLDDGSIHIEHINKDNKKVSLIILADNFLYPIAMILLEEYERWRKKW